MEFVDYVCLFNLVLVLIFYENDFCDIVKVCELYEKVI